MRQEPSAAIDVLVAELGTWEGILDKTIVGLFGAVAALGTISSSQAMPLAAAAHVLRANSYAEWLKPIDKASEFLGALDAERRASADDGLVQFARYHHHDRRRYYHHHQHEEYLRIR
jgi:hypothetical protein